MPILFIVGVAFAYFVMPVAVKFLLNFNEAEFNIQVRARDYYSFFGLLLVVMGSAVPDPDRDALGDAARHRAARVVRA